MQVAGNTYSQATVCSGVIKVHAIKVCGWTEGMCCKKGTQLNNRSLVKTVLTASEFHLQFARLDTTGQSLTTGEYVLAK